MTYVLLVTFTVLHLKDSTLYISIKFHAAHFFEAQL